jgi:hypothetical protein
MDYLKLYDKEKYLFEVVQPAFARDNKLTAFDFFYIIIWKANRAKSKVALRLLTKDKLSRRDLDVIVGDLTDSLAKANSDKERMRILFEEWEFQLPMASAILTVLWPRNFTVYDIRVCNELGNHHSVQNKTRFEDLWAGYTAYLEDVRKKEPSILTLRGKDMVLWAKSFERQLKNDITTLFRRDEDENEV